jgi:hypothetical protein
MRAPEHRRLTNFFATEAAVRPFERCVLLTRIEYVSRRLEWSLFARRLDVRKALHVGDKTRENGEVLSFLQARAIGKGIFRSVMDRRRVYGAGASLCAKSCAFV